VWYSFAPDYFGRYMMMLTGREWIKRDFYYNHTTAAAAVTTTTTTAIHGTILGTTTNTTIIIITTISPPSICRVAFEGQHLLLK